MLVLAKQYLTEATIRVVDDEFKTVGFEEITKESLSANGRLKPIAARHFAEKAERVQNLTNFVQSGLGQDQDISVHFSGLKMAKMIEELLDLADYDLVQAYVRLSERAEAQKEAMALEEENMVQASTPSGLSPEDATGGFSDQGTPEEVPA